MAEAPNDPVETPHIAETPEKRPCYEGTPFLGNYQPPRLGIIHLLAWVTVSAILMKFNLAMEMFGTSDDFGPDSFRLAMKIFTACYLISLSAILVGGAVMLFDFFRGKIGHLLPGHWIILVNALCIPLLLSGDFLVALEKKYQQTVPFDVMALVNMIASFMMMAAFIVGTLRLKEPVRWKFALAILGLENVYRCIYYLVYFVGTKFLISEYQEYLNYSVPLVAGLTATLIFCFLLVDLFKGFRPDWLHWLGAITPIVMAMLIIGIYLVFYFLFEPPSVSLQECCQTACFT